jgi:hypothetical protein
MPAEDLDEPATRSLSGRVLIGGGILLALGSTLALVLSNDLRYLRLGIIAALWAALVGAFLAAKYRGRISDRDTRAAELQQVYELELEREIAARREYELRLEQEIRNEAEEKSRHDVAALREELRSLRQTLESLLGGEVLVERFALAQSTRMRAIGEDGRPLRSAPLKRLAAGMNGSERPSEPVTERFQPVRDEPGPPSLRRVPPVREEPGPPSQRRMEPVRDQPGQPSLRRVEPVRDGPGPPSQRRMEPVREEPGPQSLRRVEPVRDEPHHPAPRSAEGPVWPTREPALPRTRPVQGLRPDQSPVVPPRAPVSSRGGEPPRVNRPRAPETEPPPRIIEPTWVPEPPRPTPRAEESGPSWTAEPPRATPPTRDTAEPSRTPWEERLFARPAHPAEMSDRWFGPDAFGDRPPGPDIAERLDEDWTPSWERDEDEAPGRHRPPPEPPPAGRRHRADETPAPARRHARPEEPAESGGGRRRRAEGAPTWQETRQTDEPVNGEYPGWRPDRSERSGSHASGHSVADLLAAHGATNPRRRRRRED